MALWKLVPLFFAPFILLVPVSCSKDGSGPSADPLRPTPEALAGVWSTTCYPCENAKSGDSFCQYFLVFTTTTFTGQFGQISATRERCEEWGAQFRADDPRPFRPGPYTIGSPVSGGAYALDFETDDALNGKVSHFDIVRLGADGSLTLGDRSAPATDGSTAAKRPTQLDAAHPFKKR